MFVQKKKEEEGNGLSLATIELKLEALCRGSRIWAEHLSGGSKEQ